MEQHFGEMFDKVKGTESTLEDNLKKVEEKVLGKVSAMTEESKNRSSGWILPFLFLLFVITIAGGFFFYMYKKATKHNHFL